jgi:hypothetical protein
MHTPCGRRRKDDGPYIVSGAAFTKYYGINTDEARRWTVVIEDGILLIDLNAEGGESATPSRS